jgi:hypothetical protein
MGHMLKFKAKSRTPKAWKRFSKRFL